MPDPLFQFDVFLSHSANDKAVVRPLAERLRKDGLKVWFDEWEIKPGDSIPAKIEEGLEHSRVLVLCMSAHAFGSDWAQLESGTFRFRDPLNKERRFIPLRFDNVPIKGSLAQFLHINFRPTDNEKEYAKLLEACRNHPSWPAGSAAPSKEEHTSLLNDYLGQVARDHRQIRIPLLDKEGDDLSKLHIDSLYVDLPLRCIRECNRNSSENEIIQATSDRVESSSHAEDEEQRVKKQKAAAVKQVFRVHERLEARPWFAILGSPGCGKTTLISYLAYACARQSLPEDMRKEFRTANLPWEERLKRLFCPRIPIVLSCRNFAKMDDGKGLEDLIETEIGLLLGKKRAKVLAEPLYERLCQGDAILLIDGLDEIPPPQQRLYFAELVARFARRFPKAAVIVTSRRVDFEILETTLAGCFDFLEVDPLGPSERKQFVEAWASCCERCVPSCKASAIKKSLLPLLLVDKSTSRLCDSIFALTLVAQTHLLHRKSGRKMPERRPDVYRRIIELLVAPDRQRRSDHQRPELTMNEVCPCLEYLAFQMHDNGETWFDYRLVQAIKDLLNQEKKESKDRVRLKRSPHELIEDVIHRTEILNYAGPNQVIKGRDQRKVGFFHGQFKEYFAAQALVNGLVMGEMPDVLSRLRKLIELSTIDARRIEGMVQGSRTELVAAGHWQEIIKFCISSLRNQDADADSTADAALLALLGPL